MPCMMFRTLLVGPSCRVADLCEMFHGQSVHIIWCIVHLFFGHYYLECVNCSAGIIRSIDTISNINLKDGMCHMKLTGL